MQKVIAVLTIFDDLFSNATLTYQNQFNDTGKSLRNLESKPRHSNPAKSEMHHLCCIVHPTNDGMAKPRGR